MPLTLPELDDRRFDDLVEEARALIPALAPQWTDHNAADPGITLIELFAYLTELLLYRVNRITAADKQVFLRLLRGPGRPPDPARTLDEELTDAVRELRREERAVTLADHEHFARNAAPDAIARVLCLPRRNLDADRASAQDAPGHISIVIVPTAAESERAPQPSASLIQTVRTELEPRRLLGAQLHVAGPRYVRVGVRVALVLAHDALPERVRAAAAAALTRFLDPLRGGDAGTGWPFGRAVHVSEIYDLLDRVPGVDHVQPARKGAAAEDELTVTERSTPAAQP